MTRSCFEHGSGLQEIEQMDRWNAKESVKEKEGKRQTGLNLF